MAAIMQRVPHFIDAEPEIATFTSVDELLAIPWIARWREPWWEDRLPIGEGAANCSAGHPEQDAPTILSEPNPRGQQRSVRGSSRCRANGRSRRTGSPYRMNESW